MDHTNDAPDVPCHVIYCDESCHELTPRHDFMTIGGLMVLRGERTPLSRELRSLKRDVGLNSELKWSKVSAKKLDAYKTIVDFFFQHDQLCYRVIVVEQKKVRLESHGKDRELAFYKFYYEMLEKWLEPGNEYTVLLDYKNNKGADRYTILRRYLENHLKGKAWIRELTVVDSRITPFAQLCDIFTGAIAAAYNGSRPGSAKELLIKYIAGKLGWTTLKVATPLSEKRFNIFRINLD